LADGLAMISRRTLSRLLLGLLLVAAGGGLLWWKAQSFLPPVVQGVTGDTKRVPDFAYQTTDGRSGRMQDLAGKVVLLHFWASWCAPCQAEFPALLDLARSLPDQLVVLAVSTDADQKNMDKFLAKIVEKQQKPLPPSVLPVHDPDSAIALDLFQTSRYPETILIDPGLRMVKKYPGPFDAWDSDSTRTMIRALSP
jgi:thiol-disulfide isomerase/thioredoxin